MGKDYSMVRMEEWGRIIHSFCSKNRSDRMKSGERLFGFAKLGGQNPWGVKRNLRKKKFCLWDLAEFRILYYESLKKDFFAKG